MKDKMNNIFIHKSERSSRSFYRNMIVSAALVLFLIAFGLIPPALATEKGSEGDTTAAEVIEETIQENETPEETTTDSQETTEASEEAIYFSDIITEDTGLWVRTAKDQWEKVDSKTSLTADHEILVRLTYRIPAGSINKNNATILYTLPSALKLPQDRVDTINNSKTQITGGKRKPGEAKDKTDESEYKAGEFAIEKAGTTVLENSAASAFTMGNSGTWKLVCTFNKESLRRNKDESVEGWLSFTINTNDLEKDEDGKGTVLFADKKNDREKITTKYQIIEDIPEEMEEETVEGENEKETKKESGNGSETEGASDNNEAETVEESKSGEGELFILEEFSEEESTEEETLAEEASEEEASEEETSEEEKTEEREIFFLEEYDDTTEEETTAEETTVEEISVEATTVEESVVEETSAEETEEVETTLEETSEEETTVEETVAEETSIEETTIEETVAEETSIEETTIEETAAEETTAEETVEETAEVETTIEESFAEETSESDISEEETPEEETSEEENTSEETSFEETSSEETTAEETTSEETTVEETTVEETAEETTVEETTAEETSSEETTVEETTAEETSSEETTAEETTVEETAEETVAEEAAFPAQSFEASTGNVNVIVYAGVGAFPPGTTMLVEDVNDDDTVSTIEDVVKENSDNSVESAHIVAVDITFYDTEGQKIDPLIPIHVAMSPLNVPENIPEEAVPVVVHLDDEGNTEVIEQRAVEEVIEEIREEESSSAAEESRKEESKAAAEESAEADNEVSAEDNTEESGVPAEDNPEKETEIATEITSEEEAEASSEETQAQEITDNTEAGFGTGMVSPLQNGRKQTGLFSARTENNENGSAAEEEILPLPEDAIVFDASSFSIYAVAYTVDFHWEANGQTYEFSIPGGGFTSFYDLVEILGIRTDDTNTEADEIQKLVDGVENLTFSDPELVSISKVEEDTTVGAIKERLGLECEYSVELTEEDITEINESEVKGGDWVLISLKPFTTEESLTVTMKNADQWTIRVTDAQITRDYITAEGETYHIEVTLDDREPLNDTADLQVEEILEGTDLYEEYLYASSASMQLESVEDITFARFFDIKVMLNGEIYEPEYPVQVKITYDEAIELVEDQKVSVVHFAESGTEVIQVVEVSEDGKELTYEQSGFSVTGTVVAAYNIVSGEKYVIYTKSGDNYYAISHASEGHNNDTVYPVKLDSGSTTSGNISALTAGSNIVWTVTKVNGNYRFSYETGGNTYYLRTYGGLMVGADSDINETSYRDTKRYTWTYDSNKRLRALSSGNNTDRYLGYNNSVIKERVNNNTSSFYFARVQDVSDVVPIIHYVDESGNELTVSNGRDWSTDSAAPNAFLIYDIDGYEYVKTTLTSIDGTVIRPILRQQAGWQYTTDKKNASSITWTDIPVDGQETSRLEDIYVIYKTAKEPVTGGTPKVKESGATEDPAIPGIYKNSVQNGDDTNTISLSITADTSPLEVEKLADVIVIFDVSTSMRREMKNNTQHNNNTTTAVNCNHNTRLWIAHNAVKQLANTLIGDNTEFQDSAHNKLIRMSLISFSDKAISVQAFTDDYDTYKKAVEDLTPNQGTNWEAALRMANQMAVDDERATFVIFVTDGNPSYRATRGNMLSMSGYPECVNDSNIDMYSSNTYYMYRANTIFGGLDENDARNYNTTLDIAKSIVDHNKNYYAIGVGPESGVNRLKDLTTYAYGGNEQKGADRTKNADSSEALTQAFSDITTSIVALLGWGDIVMTDGITDLANTVDKTGRQDVAGGFEYWKSPAPEGWDDWSKNVRAGYILGTSGKDLTYPDGYDFWEADEKNLYETAYNEGKILTTKEYNSWVSWDPATENCNEAVYDDASGSVKWDMGHRFVPETGCTYRVSFKVWPSQDAYDILAKCRNDDAFYDTLTDAQKAQIIRTGEAPSYSYTLKTNDKDPNTSFKAARKTGDGVETTGDPQTLMFNTVPDLTLASHTITVKKEWDNQLNDGRTAEPVQLGVQAIGMDSAETTDKDESLFATITVSEDTEWKGSAKISTGLMKVESGTQTIYEYGHDFTLTEDVDKNARYHWELTADTYRPMVITDSLKGYENPTAVMLKKVSSSDSYDYIIEDGYYKIQDGTAELTATNHRRSNLNLVKQVINSDGNEVASTQLFEFAIKIDDPSIANAAAAEEEDSNTDTTSGTDAASDTDATSGTDESSASDETSTTTPATDGQDIWFSVQTDPADPSTVVKNLTVEGATPEMKDGEPTGFFYAADNTEFKVKLQPGWNLRFTNLPSGTTYTITETDVTGYKFAGASVDNSGTFTVTEGTTTGNGTIDAANKQYTVTYKNEIDGKTISLWKTDKNHMAITTGASFELYKSEDYDDTTGAPKEGATPACSGTTGEDGILTLGVIQVGEYRLVETKAPIGYNAAASAIQITVGEDNVTATQEGDAAEVAQDVEENEYRKYWVAGQAEGTYQIRVWNEPGSGLPSTGGSGVARIYLLGILLTGFAGAGILMRKRRNAA